MAESKQTPWDEFLGAIMNEYYNGIPCDVKTTPSINKNIKRIFKEANVLQEMMEKNIVGSSCLYQVGIKETLDEYGIIVHPDELNIKRCLKELEDILCADPAKALHTFRVRDALIEFCRREKQDVQ